MSPRESLELDRLLGRDPGPWAVWPLQPRDNDNEKPPGLDVNKGILGKTPRTILHEFHASGMGSGCQASPPAPQAVVHATSQKPPARLAAHFMVPSRPGPDFLLNDPPGLLLRRTRLDA